LKLLGWGGVDHCGDDEQEREALWSEKWWAFEIMRSTGRSKILKWGRAEAP
jgi:hypothetical protein